MWITSLGLWSFASLRFVSPCYWNFQRSTDAAWDGLHAVRTLLVPVWEMFQSCSSDQLCVAHAVVCAFSFSRLMTLKMHCERNCRGHNSFVLPRCLFHVCLISISLTVEFSLILYLMYGLSKLRLPQNRVLAHIPSAFWVFWNLLPMQGVICDLALHWCIDRFLFFNWQSCWLQLPSGTTCLKAGVGALLLCVLFPWTVFCEEVFRISSISRVHVPTAGCWGGRAMDTACLGICFPEPCVGWERSEITTPVCSLNVLYECYDKFWEALYFWEVNSQFYTFRSFMDPQVR